MKFLIHLTNLAYVPEIAKVQPWFESVDCSYNIAQIINELNYGKSIGEIIKGRDEVLTRVRKIVSEKGKGNVGNEIK